MVKDSKIPEMGRENNGRDAIVGRDGNATGTEVTGIPSLGYTGDFHSGGSGVQWGSVKVTPQRVLH